jgi:hypothetical protein
MGTHTPPLGFARGKLLDIARGSRKAGVRLRRVTMMSIHLINHSTFRVFYL